MTMAVILPADEEHVLRRWVFAAATVGAVHVAIVFWLVYVRDTGSAGAPPAAVMIELAPLDIAPPAEMPPEVTPGPQMRQSEPQRAEQPQTIPVPELPPVPKPNAVVTTPPKPKKIVKEVQKHVVKPVRERSAPRTSAPRVATASKAAASPAASAAEAGAWRSSWAGMSWNKIYPEAARARGEQGTVRLALTIDRGGHVVSARIIASSGSSLLDQAALEMARHASGRPLPPEMGSSANLIVPVRYSIR
jgi:protein TonB